MKKKTNENDLILGLKRSRLMYFRETSSWKPVGISCETYVQLSFFSFSNTEEMSWLDSVDVAWCAVVAYVLTAKTKI